MKSKRTKKPVNKIIDAIIDSYHFLEVVGDTNPQMIADLLNSIDPTILLKYQTCSKSMQRCSLSQENLLELYYTLKDNSSKSIFLTNSLFNRESRTSAISKSITPASIASIASMPTNTLKDLRKKNLLNQYESRLQTI